MRVVRRIAAILVVAAGCGGGRQVVLPLAPELAAVDPAALTATLFLVGDAGAAAPGDRVLAELIRQGRAAPRGSTVVFLGDNAYPRGIPADTAGDFGEASRRLFALAAVADSTGLRVLMVPGNHDWDRHRETGWAQIQREDLLLRRYAAEHHVAVELAPRGGCPGPAVTETNGFRLVAIDTQWWLHSGSRPGRASEEAIAALPEPDLICPATTEAAFLDSLRAVHGRGGDQVTVMVGHHPLETHSEHGGRFSWFQYVFPFVPTPIAGWAWLPIGWIYPLGRRLVGDRQDIHSKVNRAMRRGIESTFSSESPLIYAAGHDHSLEVIRRGPNRYLLVSGAGIEDHESPVGWGDSTAYVANHPGFMRVDRLRDDRVRLAVTILDESLEPREAFHVWIRRPR